MLEWITEFLTAAASNPFLVVGAVILTTFVLEDLATVGGALLAAEGVLPVPAVVLGLFLGITLGDLGLYGLGRLAGTHPALRNWIGEKRLAKGGAWLGGRLIPSILLARVTPGLRLPCYTACGYLRLSFPTFALVAVIAVAAWSAGAFTLVYGYGIVAQAWLGQFSWAAGAVLLIAVIAWPYVFRMRSAS